MTYEQTLLQKVMMSIRMRTVTGVSTSRTQAKKLKREVAAKFLRVAMDYPGWEGRLREIWGYSGDPRFEWIDSTEEPVPGSCRGVKKRWHCKKRCGAGAWAPELDIPKVCPDCGADITIEGGVIEIDGHRYHR